MAAEGDRAQADRQPGPPLTPRSLRALVVAGAGIALVGGLFAVSGPRRSVPSSTRDLRVVAAASTTGPVDAEAIKREFPAADATGRIQVPLADRMPLTLPAEGTPPGWSLKEFAGRAETLLVRTDGRLALRLRSDHSSFALYRDAVLEPSEFPIVTWSWKVTRLPNSGDVRQRGRDDQAAQLYVIFPRWPSPLMRSDVLGYIWDTTAPVETRVTSPQADNVRLVVVESGTARLGLWLQYQRNVAEDYAALFGRKPPRVGKVAVMIDSNDTRSSAEAWFSGLAFSRAR